MIFSVAFLLLTFLFAKRKVRDKSKFEYKIIYTYKTLYHRLTFSSIDICRADTAKAPMRTLSTLEP